MRILYVEDNYLDADLTRRELARYAPHFQVDIVMTLEDARARLAQDIPYDLVLLDLKLPDGSGLSLLDDIRREGLPLAVVVLTGSGDEESAIAALKAGADDYLIKSSDRSTQLPVAMEAAVVRFRAEAARRLRPLHVIYVEHDFADIELTRRHLARYAGHIHMDVVQSGDDLFDRLSVDPENSNKYNYDVVLLDYRLHEANGLELLKTLRQKHGFDLPVVMVTGHGDEEVAIQAWRLGASDYLVKNSGYLYKLPVIIENVHNRAELAREQRALSESEARYRRLAENAQDLIYRYRLAPPRGLEYINPAATTITGYTPDEFYADPDLIFKLIHPDDRLRFQQIQVEDIINIPSAFRWIRKDGETIWTEQLNVPIYDEQENLIALEGIARNITKRTLAQMAEREQRLFAEALANMVSTLISAPDLDTVMQSMLENMADVVPHDAANIMLIEGKHARPIYWHGYREASAPHIKEFRLSIKDTPNLEQMIATNSSFLASYTDHYDEWVIYEPVTNWVKSYVAAPLRSEDKVIGFVNFDSATPGFFTEDHAQRLQVFADHASIAIEQAQLSEEIQSHATELEQRIAERTAELQQSEAKYRAVVEDQTDMVCRYLPDGTLTFVNQAYGERFQKKPEELLGTNVFASRAPSESERLEKLIASLSRENPVKTIELCDTVSGEDEYWFHWIERMIFDEAGNFVEYQGVGRDITDRKRSEEQLRQLLMHEMELSELKSRYVSMAAHDLRNPLAIIQSAISIIDRYSDRLDKEQKQAKIAQIFTSIQVMVDMLDDILTIGAVESGKLVFTPKRINVDSFCETVVAEISQAYEGRRQIAFSSTGECSIASMDSKLLRHILNNLLSNALKYSPEDSTVTFALECRPTELQFVIKDQGIGIPEAEQARLFEAFHRASNVRQIPGTGLGLAIVKQSVELHGGTIKFESKEDVGTTVSVVMPMIPTDS